MIKDFKFLKTNDYDTKYLDLGEGNVIPIYRTQVETTMREPRGINACIMEGYRANRDNLPPGQCPYDIGTPEREHWMTGWSSRENREPRPYERF